MLARYTNGAWYEGSVEGEDARGAQVLFDDSDRARVPFDGVCVLAGPVAPPPPGAAALARADTGRYLPVTVRAPGSAFVLVDGGDAGEWLAPLHHVIARGAGVAPVTSAGQALHRCTYCERLSPVGRAECDHCGAPF